MNLTLEARLKSLLNPFYRLMGRKPPKGAVLASHVLDSMRKLQDKGMRKPEFCLASHAFLATVGDSSGKLFLNAMHMAEDHDVLEAAEYARAAGRFQYACSTHLEKLDTEYGTQLCVPGEVESAKTIRDRTEALYQTVKAKHDLAASLNGTMATETTIN